MRNRTLLRQQHRFLQKKGIKVMHEINLASYKIKAKILKDGNVETVEQDYNVKESLIEVLFTRTQQISAREAIVREKLAKLIEACESDSFLLEDSDWDKVVTAINSITTVGRNDVEFVTRILEAPEVQVKKLCPPNAEL